MDRIEVAVRDSVRREMSGAMLRALRRIRRVGRTGRGDYTEEGEIAAAVLKRLKKAGG